MIIFKFWKEIAWLIFITICMIFGKLLGHYGYVGENFVFMHLPFGYFVGTNKNNDLVIGKDETGGV